LLDFVIVNYHTHVQFIQCYTFGAFRLQVVDLPLTSTGYDSVFTLALLPLSQREWCWKWNTVFGNIISIVYGYTNVDLLLLPDIAWFVDVHIQGCIQKFPY